MADKSSDPGRKRKGMVSNKPTPKAPPRSGSFLGKLIKIAVALVMGFCLVTMGMHAMRTGTEEGGPNWPWKWGGEDWGNWATFTKGTAKDLGDDLKDQVTSIKWNEFWDKTWAKGEDLGGKVNGRLQALMNKMNKAGDTPAGEGGTPEMGERPDGFWPGGTPTGGNGGGEQPPAGGDSGTTTGANVPPAGGGETGTGYDNPPAGGGETAPAGGEQPSNPPVAAQPADDLPPKEYIEAFETFQEGLQDFKNARNSMAARKRAREKFERAMDLINVAIDKKPELVDDPLCIEVQQYLHDCIKDWKL